VWVYCKLFISFTFCFEIFPFGLEGFNAAFCHHVHESQVAGRETAELLAVTLRCAGRLRK